MDPSKLHGVFKAILNGQKTKEGEGVLYVKGEECAYMMPSELKNQEFRAILEEAIDKDQSRHFFVVEERDAKLHVLTFERAKLWEEMQSEQPTESSVEELD